MIFAMFLFVFVFVQEVEKVINRDPVIRVLSKDAIRAIDSPAFEPAERAAAFMRDEEIVIGVTDGKQAKAYSTWLLDNHEIVNDVIGSTPIAVTWCPLCFTGIVYVRQIGAQPQTLTFGVSGRLWRENLVMYDRQTNSWWAQASGAAIDGKLKGSVLSLYPQSSMVTWKEWRANHPNTLVLSKRTRGGLEGMSMGYADYHRSSQIGVTGQLKFADKQLPAKTRVLGFRLDDRAYAIDLAILAAKGSVTLSANGRMLNITAARDGIGGRVFVADRDSNREEVPSFVSYWFAWKAFFPATALVQP
jgi:hypothetical protein